MPPIDYDAKAREVMERGFCILPAVHSAAECEEMRRLLDEYWVSQDSPDLAGFGMGIHPLFPKVPALAPFLAQRDAVEVLRRVLHDEVRMTHAGARISDERSDAAIGWHEHYSWDKSAIPTRTRCERVLGGIYVDGSTAPAGNLIALPRRFNDPLGAAPGAPHASWPNEVIVEAPPGSWSIFDTALWHTARRGSQPGKRRLFGCHFQAWSNPRPHPEDNDVNPPAVEGYKKASPLLRGLLDGPGAKRT